MQVDRILESSLYVRDLEQAKTFYQTVLGAELDSEQQGRHAFFRIGRQMLLLFVANASRELDGDIPPHGADGAGHLAFSAPHKSLPAWEEQLARHGVTIEYRKQWSNGAISIYFRDPSGNSLELATPCLWFADEKPDEP